MPDDPSTAYEYDVFISYSHADRAWVRGELLPRLEAAGLKVCVDWRDFRPGAPSVKEMARAVRQSQRTVPVLTPAYLASAWAEFETLMLQTLDPANRKLRLIPLLKEKCELPVEIGYLTYVNFADPDDPEWPWTQLLTALGRPPAPQVALPPAAPTWFLAHPFAMPPNFTGRDAERGELSAWLDRDPGHPLLVVRALGGFGKSALAWHWLHHDVDPRRWPRVVWWSFYEPEATCERFLEATLAYLGVDPRRVPGPRQQVEALLYLLRAPGTLLILDGFEGALRAYGSMMAAYQGDVVAGECGSVGEGGLHPSSFRLHPSAAATDCISPAAELFLRAVAVVPGLRGKVLLTTRLTPRVLEAHDGGLLAGCREIELAQMEPADAVAFMRRQGIRGGRGEIAAACGRYGCHPLSLALLAGWIKRDFQQPGDIAAAARLDLTGDLVQRRHHVLETAYESLAPDRRRLLSRIACFRGPVAYEALAALADVEAGDAGRGEGGKGEGGQGGQGEGEPRPYDVDAALHDLVDRGLLHRGEAGKPAACGTFDLHPIVRRYAYDRLGAEARAASHARLRDYFAALPAVERPRTPDDLAPTVELYHHTLRAGQFDAAVTLYRDRLADPLYFQFGAYQLEIELLAGLFPGGAPLTPAGRPVLPRLRKEGDQAWTLNALANSYSLSGQPRRAVPLFERSNDIDEKRGNKQGVAIGLGNLAVQQMAIGALRPAEANLRRSIALCRELGDEFWEAVGRQELGWLLAYRGAWAEVEGELAAALGLFEKQGEIQSQGVVWAYRALAALLQARDRRGPAADPRAALSPARRALELADETARTRYPHERDYVQAHWLLGAAHRLAGGLDAAGRHLDEALRRCRAINVVEHEADILLELARWSFDSARQGTPGSAQDDRGEEARRVAEEALEIAERCGYVLQAADAHLFLAQMARDAGDRAGALAHAQAARDLAACDGGEYTYRVAWEEADALLG